MKEWINYIKFYQDNKMDFTKYLSFSIIINVLILFMPLNSLEVVNKLEPINKTKIIVKLQNNPKKTQIPKEKIKNEEIPKEESKKEEIKTKINKKNFIRKEVKKPKNKSKITKKIPIKEFKKEDLHKRTLEKKLDKNELDSKENKNICKNNIGFKILNEPRLNYPKKALMLGLRGNFYVEVDFKIISGEIKIINVRGKNTIFNNEAIKITKNLSIKVLVNDISNCLITKPYEFRRQ